MADTFDVGTAEVNERKDAETRAKEGRSLENMLDHKYIQFEEVILIEVGESWIEYDLREWKGSTTSYRYIFSRSRTWYFGRPGPSWE